MNGSQIPLRIFDPDKLQEARDALAALLAQLPQKPEADDWPALVEQFLAHKAARNLKAKTLKGYRRHLGAWLARFGTTPRADLTAEVVQDHAHSFPTWGPNQRRNYLCTAEGFLKWARHPLAIDKPGRESAGAESVIPEQAHWQAVGSARGDLKALLCFLWHSGCRPSEGSGLTAEGVDWESGTVRLREHKTRGRGKDRLVYLSPGALEVLTRQRERHKTGLLFRNRLHRRYSDTGLSQAMWRISARIGHHVTAYGYRHTYATRALEKGLPDTHVAALLGHSSTKMIHAHYSHISQNARLLKEAAAKVG